VYHNTTEKKVEEKQNDENIVTFHSPFLDLAARDTYLSINASSIQIMKEY